MTLEEIIMNLTSRTPSGGMCTIGDVSFNVWYCSDIWEWEYRGETFWDAQDLAEAIVRESSAALQGIPSLFIKAKAKERPPDMKWKRPMMVSSTDPARFDV
jgi:hypothetical protein